MFFLVKEIFSVNDHKESYFYIFEKSLYSLKLIIDIGNSLTKLALFNNKELVLSSSFVELSSEILHDFIAGNKITSTIISSVKKVDSKVNRELVKMDALLLNDKTALPVINMYKTPTTLGKDRLAAVVGASVLFPNKNVVIFDSGTCLTIDFVNSNKEYLGGRISPGIRMRYKSLHTFTENLPLIKDENAVLFIGNDTNSSIISGVNHGILSEVDAVISEYKKENKDSIFVVTGGDCFFFEKGLKNSIFANPDLVLIGLNEILDYNE